jgi:hypothetical protein
LPILRRLPGRKQGEHAARSLDELQVGNKIAQFFNGIPLHKAVAFDNHKYVIFAGRKTLREILKLLEFRSVRAEK